MSAQDYENTIARLDDQIAELEAILQAAVDCGMIPTTSAKDGGAANHSEQARVADRIRAALEDTQRTINRGGTNETM